MSSINLHPTFHYSQPADYHFSHDSVFLARQVFEQVSNQDITDWDVLDLCAGCGVIGLDFIYHCHKELGLTPKTCDFLEVQNIYTEHFEINKRSAPPFQGEWLLTNYETLKIPAKKYNLILCNPPYFFTHQGMLSPSDFKNRCRFFMDSTLEELFKALANALKAAGAAYVLLPDGKEHGSDPLLSLSQEALKTLQIETTGDIRGTRLLKISHYTNSG